jgi:hypothetical protein
MSLEEYFTINEVAARLKLSPKTIKNKMASEIFRKGVHYFRSQGLRPRFKWSAVQAWLTLRLQNAKTPAFFFGGISLLSSLRRLPETIASHPQIVKKL